MKKLIKNVFITTTVISIPFFINSYIFKKVEDALTISDDVDDEYNWIHGKVNYTVQGDGEPLLLLHGIYTGASSFEFHKNIESLKQNYKVYAIDLLGFGKSEKPNITYSSYLYISLINSFIKDIIKQPVYVISSSLSANYALMAYKFKPSNFKKIVLISPDVYDIDEKSKTQLILSNLINIPILGTSLYNLMSSKNSINNYLKNNMFSENYKISEDYIDNLYKVAHRDKASSKHPFVQLISEDLYLDITNHIKDVKAPLYIAFGDLDHINNLKKYLTFMDSTPNINIYKFDNCKTAPHIEKHEEFNEYFLSILK